MAATLNISSADLGQNQKFLVQVVGGLGDSSEVLHVTDANQLASVVMYPGRRTVITIEPHQPTGGPESSPAPAGA
jgi:hypothetical protein